MSDINTGAIDSSERLNQAAAHDTGIYDPSVHDNQIVAMYETDAGARGAYDALVGAGVPAGAIQVIARGADSGILGGVNAEDRDSGIWGAIRNLFAPDEDRSAYSHAVGQGHAMLVIVPEDGMDRQNLVRLIENTGPIDFDAKLEQWRQAGYDTSSAHPASLGGSPVAESSSKDSAGAMPVATVGAAAVLAGQVAGQHGSGAEDGVREVREESRVGRREVQSGRVRSYLAERPVQGS